MTERCRCLIPSRVVSVCLPLPLQRDSYGRENEKSSFQYMCVLAIGAADILSNLVLVTTLERALIPILKIRKERVRLSKCSKVTQIGNREQ